MDKKGLLTEVVVNKIIHDFTVKMHYPPKEIVARREDVGDDIIDMVTSVNKGLQLGHVLVYPIINREPMRFQGERTPV